MKTLHEWERKLKAKLRERGCPMDGLNRWDDELMRPVFRPERTEALRNYQCDLKDTFLRRN
ncbi:hypothetical protein [Microvirga ossetica]|uniref:hypothetical protein n=1 Tax=Microvirga ossetica TaxID=1882682 RepID=UPI0012FFDEB6|nr:hypothetical protein [Microvirga ossetica]